MLRLYSLDRDRGRDNTTSPPLLQLLWLQQEGLEAVQE